MGVLVMSFLFMFFNYYPVPWRIYEYHHENIYLYNFDPLKPHFYIVKLGVYRDIHYFSLLKNIDCGYSLEPPWRGGSNEHPQSMF